MSIRLDQLHGEVFAKITSSIESQENKMKDYLDSKVASLDVSLGLPETTYVDKVTEVNYRNIEKSGFIDLNRNFAPIRTAPQGNVGVWISNLGTAETTFEPRTIDGQKRGISIAGQLLNYTSGVVGSTFSKLLQLPAAPNLPVFFPEKNDLETVFSPTKIEVVNKQVIDETVSVYITDKITDHTKVDVNVMTIDNKLQHYYTDEFLQVWYLGTDGKTYPQNSTTSKIESYKRFSVSFAKSFDFVKIIDNEGISKFVDTSTSIDQGQRLFEIKTPVGTNAVKVPLKYNSKDVYLSEMTVKRVKPDESGNLVSYDVTQLMLVNTSIVESAGANGVIGQRLFSEPVSNIGITKKTTTFGTDPTVYEYIEDSGIRMFLKTEEVYYFFPTRKYSLDVNGEKIELTEAEKNADTTKMYHAVNDGNTTVYYKLEYNTETRSYVPIGSAKPVNGVMTVVDSITGESHQSPIYTTNIQSVEYYKIDTLMFGDTSTSIILLNDAGNPVDSTQTPNKNRPVSITSAGTLTTLTSGYVTPLSLGKDFYYHLDTGTKYYKSVTSNKKYFVDTAGTIYFPYNDVQEIYSAEITNLATVTKTHTLVYGAAGMYFYLTPDSIRMYINEAGDLLVQLTDINGYKIFKNATNAKVYVNDDGHLVNINTDGVESASTETYATLTPLFETESVEAPVLNLVRDIPFNIAYGKIYISRNGVLISKYFDYQVTATLKLLKSLEFNTVTGTGDTLYIKREGKKDIIFRLEKTGSPANDALRHWAEETGNIIISEPLTGNSLNWTEGQHLQAGQKLKNGDVVKASNSRYYKYTGTEISFESMGTDKSIVVTPSGIFWNDVTAPEVEYERSGQNYKIFSAGKNDTIRFTITRRMWEINPTTGERTVKQHAPYTLEKTALQTGYNLFVLADQNFAIDDVTDLESYTLQVENIKPFSTFKKNRANNLRIDLTGLQTVAKNLDAAMVYSDDYTISACTLILTSANITDTILVKRIQAPQSELMIEMVTSKPNETVHIPFEIIQNKYDVIVPEVVFGNEYSWIVGDELPEGRVLNTGDILFDKAHLKFYKYLSATKGKTVTINGVSHFEPAFKQSLTKLSLNTQKEIVRQYNKLPVNLNPGAYWASFNALWIKKAKDIALTSSTPDLIFTDLTNENLDNLNIVNQLKLDFLRKAMNSWMTEISHKLNDTVVDSFESTQYMTDAERLSIKDILFTHNTQSVLKKPKLDDAGVVILDENASPVYTYEYIRSFMVETRVNPTSGKEEFISRSITGAESVITGVWENITVSDVSYYRYGKSFTVLDTKKGDNVVVRLADTGAEALTSATFASNGGELTFSLDFNIEDDNGVEIPFEVIHNKINWVEGMDYIQEGQKLTLTMIPKGGQSVIVRRNDQFKVSDVVILERKDLVFIETWHEDITETDFIFPYGNVQYQGNSAIGLETSIFDHKFYDSINGETTEIENGALQYCQTYQKSNIVYNYISGGTFENISADDKKFVDASFAEDNTLGRGWKFSKLTEMERNAIFKHPDNNLYYDGSKIIQVRYRTRIVALNLFENYFKGTSEYLSSGLRFQGKSPYTDRTVIKTVGYYTSADGKGLVGKPKTETINIKVGGPLVISDNPKSILYQRGELFDDALFTVETPTSLSYDGIVNAVPVAIINRRNQGVYHKDHNPNGTGFFINGIKVTEDKEDFRDDISGFSLFDETGATLETSSVGRDRKAKFNTMLRWLFSNSYKAGGSMSSKTTYRPDGLLHDEVNLRDIIDLRIDANFHRKRLELLESDVALTFKDLKEFKNDTSVKFDQNKNYIDASVNLLYSHISKTEVAIRKDYTTKYQEVAASLEDTKTHLSDLAANVFSKSITKNLLVDSLMGLTEFNTNAAFITGKKPTRNELVGMVDSFVENVEGPYNKSELMKFLVTVLKSITAKNTMSDEELDRWIRRLSVKDMVLDADTSTYSRAETLELIFEGMLLASTARILPPIGSNSVANWTWKGTRYAGWLGTRNIDLNKDFLDAEKTPVASKIVKNSVMTRTYDDIMGKTWSSGFIAGPTVWGDVHNYHAIYTTWMYVSTPFKVENVKMLGDDSHAIYINKGLIASNKYCCRETAYSYDFAVAGWYRIDMVYSDSGSSHYMQLGWSPSDYQNNIKYMTTTDMDSAVEITKYRLDNWASKLKSLSSTIKGDATGYFTKLEVKLVLIEGLKKIRNHILTFGETVSQTELNNFHLVVLYNWLNSVKFSDLGYTVQPEVNPTTGVETPRSDLVRPVPNMTGKYNKLEAIEIVRRGLQLVNGIDSINATDIQRWSDYLDIKINMPSPRYYTTAQVDALVKAGSNYLTGLDAVSSHDVSLWVDAQIVKKDLVFNDANGVDLAPVVDTNAYTKTLFKSTLLTKLKALLGAQAAKTQI